MPLPERKRFRIKDLAKRWERPEEDVREEIRTGHFKHLIVSTYSATGTQTRHYHITDKVPYGSDPFSLKAAYFPQGPPRVWHGSIHSIDEFPWPSKESNLYIPRAEVETFEIENEICPVQKQIRMTGGDLTWIKPKLLRVAVEVYYELYVLKNVQPKQAHKKQIHDWLSKKYPKLSKRGKEQIATVVNPNKHGGAPRSE